MAYAAETKVPVLQTQGEIKKMLTRVGCGPVGILEDPRERTIQVLFELDTRRIIFRMTIPDASSQRGREQKERSAWRALAQVIKFKLESIEAGIETLEQAFLAHIMQPDGRTYGETLIPELDNHIAQGGVPRLTFGGGDE